MRDNGIGILPEDSARVFKIFERLDPDSTAGEGLGLALVKKIVETYGGKIWVESQLGKGTTFWFTITKDIEAAKTEPEVAGELVTQ